jgi:YjbR
MTRDGVLSFCAGLVGAVEDYPFGDGVKVFKVGGRMFALIMLTGRDGFVNLECDPDLALELRGSPCRGAAWVPRQQAALEQRRPRRLDRPARAVRDDRALRLRRCRPPTNPTRSATPEMTVGSVEQAFKDRFAHPDLGFDQLDHVGQARLRQDGKAQTLDHLNRQIAPHGGMALASLICTALVITYRFFDKDHPPIVPCVPILAVAMALLALGFRCSWRWYGEHVVRNVLALPPPPG